MKAQSRLRSEERDTGKSSYPPEALGIGYPNRYAPIPPNGKRCEFTGLQHAKRYHLLSAGGPLRKKVRVANLRTAGAKRGQTFWRVASWMNCVNWLYTGLGRAKDAADEGKGFSSHWELLTYHPRMGG